MQTNTKAAWCANGKPGYDTVTGKPYTVRPLRQPCAAGPHLLRQLPGRGGRPAHMTTYNFCNACKQSYDSGSPHACHPPTGWPAVPPPPPTGWLCPRCQTINAPTAGQCPTCTKTAAPYPWMGL